MNPCITIENRGSVVVISFTTRKILGKTYIQQMGERLFRLVDEQGHKNIILNFGDLDYVSSVALGKLIVLCKKCKAAGGRLVICDIPDEYPSRDIYSVFEITKLKRLFEVSKQDPGNPTKGLREALTSFSC